MFDTSGRLSLLRCDLLQCCKPSGLRSRLDLPHIFFFTLFELRRVSSSSPSLHSPLKIFLIERPPVSFFGSTGNLKCREKVSFPVSTVKSPGAASQLPHPGDFISFFFSRYDVNIGWFFLSTFLSIGSHPTWESMLSCFCVLTFFLEWGPPSSSNDSGLRKYSTTMSSLFISLLHNLLLPVYYPFPPCMAADTLEGARAYSFLFAGNSFIF